MEINSSKKLTILPHNGVCLEDYPCQEFQLYPYPASKQPIFNHDNLSTPNRPYYLEDADFLEVLYLAESRWGTPGLVRDISWRLHILLTFFAMAYAKNPNGCYVELGTGKGYMAFGIANYFKSTALKSYLYDTFFPDLPCIQHNTTDSTSRFAYAEGGKDYSIQLEGSLNGISKIQEWNVIQGMLPDVLTPNLPRYPISFLHVDLNEPAAEIASLQILEHLMDENTIILFDDTGAPGAESQHVAHKNYAKSRGKKLLYLPTGQAVLL